MKDQSQTRLIAAGQVIFAVLALLCLFFVVQPQLYFHHVQPSFLVTAGFLKEVVHHPGGISEYAACFLMQSFYNRYAGTLVFWCAGFLLWWLVWKIMSFIHRDKRNGVLALLPALLAPALAYNYNFPFSSVVSVILVGLFLLLSLRISRNFSSRLFCFVTGAALVYYSCGSGYMVLYAVSSLFLIPSGNGWKKVAGAAFMVAFAVLFPLLACRYFFVLSPGEKYGYFFAPKMYFMAYEPPVVYSLFLVSVPALLAWATLSAYLQKRNYPGFRSNAPSLVKTFVAFIVVAGAVVLSHKVLFQPDARKIIACDYHCYHGNPDKTKNLATSLREYSFAANLNYNLALSKAGRLTGEFFDFFQMAGAESLCPDNEFLADRAFIAADFYYHLGYISEARHWAYEAMVFYPYSPRNLQLLVKIHLITGEYRAAERFLGLLDNTLTSRSFVRMFRPYVKDTCLISGNREIAEKRGSIPQEKELSPFVEARFRELLDSNPGNKSAYEFLMLYYLLEPQPEKFLDLFRVAGRYFTTIPEVYEEAFLLYNGLGSFPEEGPVKISQSTLKRYGDFMREAERYRGDPSSARKALYPQYGKSYLYYVQYVYPRIIKPEIITEEGENIPI